MKVLHDLMLNKTLVAAIISWLSAQFIKFGLGILINGEADFTKLTSSGGMPSGHAALVTAVAVGIGRNQGFFSSQFALATVIAFIVMYDAAGVRQAVGIQAQIMNDILDDIYKGSGITPVKIKEILGHTPVEVIAGAILGLIIAFVF